MACFVEMTQLPMIVPLNVMKQLERFCVQHTKLLLGVNRERYVLLAKKTLKVNIVLATLFVRKNANGMTLNALMA